MSKSINRGGRNRRFFHELTPLARKLEAISASTPAPLSTAKDYNACAAKQATKLARRANHYFKPSQPTKDTK